MYGQGAQYGKLPKVDTNVVLVGLKEAVVSIYIHTWLPATSQLQHISARVQVGYHKYLGADPWLQCPIPQLTTHTHNGAFASRWSRLQTIYRK